MQINKIDQIKFEPVGIEGAKDCTMKILASSPNIVMRLFKVEAGGHTPHHQHDFEHVIKIHSGSCIIVDEKGIENKVDTGYSAYIEANKMHQFKSLNNQPFEFICIIPSPDKK